MREAPRTFVNVLVVERRLAGADHTGRGTRALYRVAGHMSHSGIFGGNR